MNILEKLENLNTFQNIGLIVMLTGLILPVLTKSINETGWFSVVAIIMVIAGYGIGQHGQKNFFSPSKNAVG